MSNHVEGALTTPFGVMNYAITNGGHVCISGHYLRVNNADYNQVSIHLYLDKGWNVNHYNDVYMSRPDFKSPSNAANAKVQKVLGDLWREFIAKHPEKLIEATVNQAEWEAQQANDKIAELKEQLEAELAKYQAAIDKADAARKQLTTETA